MVQVGQFVASKPPQNKIMRFLSATDSGQNSAATYESVVQRLAGIQAMENWRRVSSPFQPNRVRAGRVQSRPTAKLSVFWEVTVRG